MVSLVNSQLGLSKILSLVNSVFRNNNLFSCLRVQYPYNLQGLPVGSMRLLRYARVRDCICRKKNTPTSEYVCRCSVPEHRIRPLLVYHRLSRYSIIAVEPLFEPRKCKDLVVLFLA